MNALFFLTAWVWFLPLFTLGPMPTTPPYHGTIFIDRGIITNGDSSLFVNSTYVGRGMRKVYDRRTESWTNINAFLFKIVWSDGLTAEAQINPEFQTVEAASKEARKYGRIVGRLPTCLRTEIKALWIHKGVKLFGGPKHAILIHTGQTALYEEKGILEEALFHEASHAALDETHATASDWVAAQQGDPAYISSYAQENPEREDIAETFLLWYAVRQCDHRISQENYDKITQTIAHRLEYFDNQGFDMYPLCIE